MNEQKPLLTLDEMDAMITAWNNAQSQAATWSVLEMELRKQIFGAAFPVPVVGAGNKFRLNHGMALIGTHKINYKIDGPGLETAREFIPPQTFADVVGYTPKIRDGAYRKLEPEDQRQFHAFITETPGAPSIELKPANKVRW